MLGPTLEIIPQLLIIPVILFVVGLLDAIFTRILGLEVLPTPIAAASGLSLFFITGITAFLVFALVHASSRHDSSPFQSTLARFISNVIDKAFGVDPRMRGVKRGRIRELYTRNIYHEIVQATHDDETLDKAVTALGTLGWRSWSDNLNNTFVHLLSPEASIRCNQTAARVIVDLEELFKSNGSTRLLLSDLARAAYRRAENNRPATLWTSTYIKAYAVIARAFRKDYPPVLCILGSDYATRPTKRLMSMDDLLLDIFFDYIDLVSPDGFPTPPMVQLFEPDFIVPRNVLRFIDRPYISLEEFESGSRDNRISVIISLLMAAKTPAVVMAAAREQIIEGGFSGIMVDFLVVKAVLQLPEESAEWQDTHMLEGLCSLCLDVAKSRSHRNHIPATVNATLTRLPPTGAASTALTGLLADLRQSHDPAQIWAS
ncbi:hypothetical protein B0H17DRAFT_1103732 [Mycena rosella]|uniref:Uncharacterized protein n=1 Tax=Mycena rosella TaxID=1033263 RepID=A0AAD7FZG6_MYCRO|nr:hypothetical protein B0H17DRAFT_1103732 [Mycena rosella]